MKELTLLIMFHLKNQIKIHCFLLFWIVSQNFYSNFPFLFLKNNQSSINEFNISSYNSKILNKLNLKKKKKSHWFLSFKFLSLFALSKIITWYFYLNIINYNGFSNYFHQNNKTIYFLISNFFFENLTFVKFLSQKN